MDVAERLYAERGLHAVAARDIAIEAGQRNASAVNYHFGDRDGLVLAILTRRMDQINEVRRERLRTLQATGRDGDVRALVEAYVGPFAEFVTHAEGGSHYARFIQQALVTVGGVPDENGTRITEAAGAARDVVDQLRRALTHLDPALARRRIRTATAMVVAGVAEFERSAAPGRDVARVTELVDMMTGALLAEPTTS